MTELAVFNFDQWNALQIAGAQAESTTPLDFTVGTDTLALVESSTASLLYLQADILAILALTRAATSVGGDLDSWMADYSFTRLPPTFTTGTAQLYRDQTTSTVSTPADGSATLLLSDGTQTYQIVADTGQTAYLSGSNTYSCPTGSHSINVSVVAVVSGTGGNAPVGGQLLLGANITGFDTASIVSGFVNGSQAESDAAFRARFVLYLQSLSRGTIPAISFAILSVQAGLNFTILNNQDTVGKFEPGNFVVTVDDGSGNPPDSLLAAVDAAVTAYQGNTISHNVRRPIVVNAVVSMTVIFVRGTDTSQQIPALLNIVSNYINTRPLGQTLAVTRLSSLIYDASAAVVNVQFVTINSAAADLVITPAQVVKLASNGLIINPVVSS